MRSSAARAGRRERLHPIKMLRILLFSARKKTEGIQAGRNASGRFLGLLSAFAVLTDKASSKGVLKVNCRCSTGYQHGKLQCIQDSELILSI